MWTKAAVGLAIMVSAHGALAATPPYDSNGSPTLEHALKDANVAAYHGRLSEAIAIDTKVITESPDYGAAYYARGKHLMSAGRYTEAEVDINHVFAMHPDARELQMQLIRLSLLRGDGKKALEGIAVAAKMPMQSFWHSPFEAGAGEFGNGLLHLSSQHAIAALTAYGSIAELLTHQDDAAINDLDSMVKIESTQPWYVLNNYCYTAAVAGQLEMAELACQESIDRNSHDTGQYDSLGFTHLRMKAWAKAIDDYNKSLGNRNDLTFSLYGRGIAERAMGNKASGDADIAAATKGEPDIANIMKRLGVPVS